MSRKRLNPDNMDPLVRQLYKLKEDGTLAQFHHELNGFYGPEARSWYPRGRDSIGMSTLQSWFAGTGKPSMRNCWILAQTIGRMRACRRRWTNALKGEPTVKVFRRGRSKLRSTMTPSTEFAQLVRDGTLPRP